MQIDVGYFYFIKDDFFDIINDPELNFSISDYEENLVDTCNIEKIAEENEHNRVVLDTLKTVKPEEYKIFIMLYYESKSVKEIAKKVGESIHKVGTKKAVNPTINWNLKKRYF